MSLAVALENGPAARSARRAHIEARISLADTKARQARDRAASHRRKAKGKSGWHAAQVAIQERVAEDQAKEANRLRLKLAKDARAEAKRNADHAKRVAGSTAAEGLVPKTPGQGGQPGSPKVATPGHQPTQPKGTKTMPAVSGEAVTLEQAQAVLDQLATQASELRSAAEQAAGSLASGGLAKVAGPLSAGDDALDTFVAGLKEAQTALAPHQDIAESVQAAGEMHQDRAFYGVA